ncbi:MAG: helix-turn-helix domain-containing protein [Lachnospiraceae bacterium]|nr:helix-turn-helix domain-containing protein [Lachnospiraceae bacterium]
MKYERIRNLREDRDLTQAELADYLNISQRAYSHYENGERAIPVEILIKLAIYYATSIDYLVNYTDVKKPYPPGGQYRSSSL